jgi:Protein of unknown function (DUF1553)/Protein of unknown function (DUF1549)/Planctomycete cytochrome C
MARRWLASVFAASAFGCICLSVQRTSRADAPVPAAGATRIDFSKQIRPILSDNCFQCHGPDEGQRKAKLRLDTKQGAFVKLRGGGFAIVPGKPGESKLLERITAADPSERMPPARTNKKLTPQQIELFQQWIEQGASYADHWAFVAPQRPALPQVQRKDWPRNGLDYFILARLEKEGLQPAPEADPVALIRRLTLDLTGLPPTPAEVDGFMADCGIRIGDSKDNSAIRIPQSAIEKVVNRLLASPHFGERMAVDWLDAARFADTHGYHIDSGRDMSRWREWIIDAFNSNMPFDQFTIEQLAGDLLPNATLSQKVASGFNRNHMINFEGGAIPEEYHNAYIVDRVNTTATVWLGLTMTCAQCHDHKYDPISQKEYYQLYAFFHNVPESGLDGSKGNAAPFLKTPTTAQQQALDDLNRRIKDAEATAAQAAETAKAELAKLRQAKVELEKAIPSAMVMQEMPAPRETFVRIRGDYAKKGEKVQAGVPAFLPSLPPGASANRLALAKWLVSPDQPLTSRVIGNRYWQMIFGTGLVKSVEDFGSQSEPPSHPELLDWLAVEFMNPVSSPLPPGEGSGVRGWDIKRFIHMLVTSATYRQSSAVTKEHLAKDADNRLYARGPRYRLQAEFIRDQALAISGLLNREIGGASVSPYQPKGLWRELSERSDSKNWTAQFFVQSKGKDLYRRTIYTFWKRTSPPPQLVTFDAPDRETCTVRRGRTNTPLQALILMNDPTYVEASRKLAERLMREAKTTDERIALGFRLATARLPGEREAAVLRGVFEKQLGRFRTEPQAAGKLLSVGEAPRDERLPLAELAAWSIVASVILNLDETVTKN